MNSSSQPLRLIHCGVGGHGASWVKSATSLSNDFETVAIVDLNSEPLQAAGEILELGPEQQFSSLESALNNVQADAVLSVTPPTVHLPHAKLAFENELHFLTEKPFADTLENAQEMRHLARESGKQLMVNQNYRFQAGVQTLKTLLQSQTVGEFGHGHMDFYIPGDFTGSFRETMEFPLLVDMAIHHFDLIRTVTNQDIVRVTAHSFRPKWSWYQHEPGLKMLLELSDGASFSYSGDWSALGRATSWSGNWRLQCSEGALHFENGQISVSRSERWMKNETVETINATPLESEGLAASLSLFAQSIRENKPAQTSGDDNIKSLAAVFAAVQSAKEKRSVDVEF